MSANDSDSPTFPPIEPLASEPADKPVSPITIWLACVAVLFAAFVFGGFWHGIGYYFLDAPIVFPIFAALGAGWLVGNGLRRSATKNSNFAAVCGIIAGVLTMLSRHGWDAVAERSLMVEALLRVGTERSPEISLADLMRNIQAYLDPWRTFLLHFEIHAAAGETVSGVSPRTAWLHVNLRGGWYYGLLVLETVVMGFTGGLAVSSTLSVVACPTCGKSRQQKLLFSRHSNAADTVLSLTQRQDWRGVMNLPKERYDEKNLAEVYLLRCESETCPGTVFVDSVAKPAPKQRLLSGQITAESANTARAASIAEPI